MIVAQYSRHRAAMKIQAIWRGRDVRDWLAYPGARALNPRHPIFSHACHLRHCVDCYVNATVTWRTLQVRFQDPFCSFAWIDRGEYLERYRTS
jgi:hypothetical protein